MWRLTGVAIHILDSTGRLELKSNWFGEEAQRIGGRMTVLTLLLLTSFIVFNFISFRSLAAPGWLAGVFVARSRRISPYLMPFAQSQPKARLSSPGSSSLRWPSCDIYVRIPE